MGHLEIFADESYGDSSNGVLTLAALLAPDSHWPGFVAQWSEVLSSHGVVEFHATDCEGRQRQFRGWTRAQVSALQLDLARVICDDTHGILLFSSSLSLSGYSSVRERLRPLLRIPSGLPVSGGWDDAYFYLFQQLLQMCLDDEHLEEIAPDAFLEFIFDQHQFAWRAVTLATGFHRFRTNGHRLRDVRYRSRKEAIALQAADFAAYEVFRYQSLAKSGGTPDRWQYQALTSRLRKEVFMDADYLAYATSQMESEVAARGNRSASAS